MEGLSFQVEVFEGPLDLLLHLVRKNRVSIYDIPISEITEQYFEYLARYKSMDIDISAEFLVTAAELLYIKSRLLLPRPQAEGEEGEDPRAELALRLSEYKKIKEAAERLKEYQSGAERLFFKEAEKLDIKPPPPEISIPIEQLVSAFLDVQERNLYRTPPAPSAFSGVIEREKVSVPRQAWHVWKKLGARKTVKFEELFEGLSTRPQYVATFLALLEMIKLGKVQVLQRNNGIALKKSGDFNGLKDSPVGN